MNDIRTKMRNNINDSTVFGPQGWINRLYPDIRKDLVFIFDDGWDVPYNVGDKARFGSLIADSVRMKVSGHPQERLKIMSQKVRKAGWKGLGLWVACQTTGEVVGGPKTSAPEAEKYWRERARWCKAAGISYWKVDWGVHEHDIDYRKMMTRVAHEEAPGLVIEHAFVSGVFNDLDTKEPYEKDGKPKRFADMYDGKMLDLTERTLASSDVFRTYDVTMMLSVATTLDRTAAIIEKTQGKHKVYLNVEDELYLGAVFHQGIGIMRAPLPKGRKKLPYHNSYDMYDRNTEVARAVNWYRFAPPATMSDLKINIGEKLLTDLWNFGPRPDQFNNVLAVQSAPAVVSINMALPTVSPVGNEAPYVISSVHKNGAVAVAVLPRTSVEKGIYTPLAKVSLPVDKKTTTVGIFGQYEQLTLTGLSASSGKIKVMAQDLAGGEVVDITKEINVSGNNVVIPGATIQRVGTMKNTEKDLSESGLVLKIVKGD